MTKERKPSQSTITERQYPQSVNAAGLVCAAAAILLIFRKAVPSAYNQTGMIHGLNFNIVVYALAVLTAFAVYIAAGLLEQCFFYLARIHHSAKTANLIAGILSCCTAACFLFYLYKVYADETNNFPDSLVADTLRQRVSHPLYFAVICIAALLLFLVARRCVRLHAPTLRWMVILIGALFCAWLVWCPSPYYDLGGTMLHVHAYTNSIANAAALVPFSRLNLSIYGHYALIYLPFVKLFGGGYPAVALTISLFEFLTLLFAGYAAHKAVKNDVLFFLTSIAMVGTVTIMNRRGQYYQTNPHRLLLSAFSLACVAWKEFHIKRKDALRIRLLELAIGIFAVTWNLETGLFAVTAISLERILRKYSENRFFSKPVWREILLLFLNLLLAFFGSWAVVGLYNLLTGGTFESVRTFIYPFLSGNYDVNHLRLPLRGETALSTFETILFALAAFSCLRGARLKRTPPQPVLFTAAVSGLMNLLYFMNRTAYGNIQICHIQLIAVAGILADYAVNAPAARLRFRTLYSRKAPETNLFAFLVSGVLYIGVFFLAVETLAAVPESLIRRRDSHSQELSAAETWYTQIRDNVPKNTFAYGIGMPEAYMSLHWDTGCHMIDFADRNDYNDAYLERLITKQNAVLTTDSSFPENHPEFEAQGSWTAYYCTATYYVRK